jgi:predicted molibdopterin-dependent oxidoreductase YjgC
MTAPSTLFRPFTRLLKITILGRNFEVPENNTVLRCFQYLQPEPVAYGRFCWNEDCQYCRISFDVGEGTGKRAALSCKLLVEDGMRISEISREIGYCLRALKLPRSLQEPVTRGGS